MFKGLPTAFALAANLILPELAFAGDVMPVSYLSINNHEITQTGINNPEVGKILRTQKGLSLLEGHGYAQSPDLQSFSFEVDGAHIMKGAPGPGLLEDADTSELTIFDFNGAAANEDMPVYSDKDIAEFRIELAGQGGNFRARFTSPAVINAQELDKIQKAGGFAYLRYSP
jgi:hypothetical protein